MSTYLNSVIRRTKPMTRCQCAVLAVLNEEWASVGLNTVSQFAAVDDEDHRFTDHGIPSVITDGGTGLTAADADRLIELLGRAA